MPIPVPAGVEVSVAEGNMVTVKGPKGALTKQLHPAMKIEQEGNVIVDELEALDIALVQQNLSNALFHVGGGDVDGLMLGAGRGTAPSTA